MWLASGLCWLIIASAVDDPTQVSEIEELDLADLLGEETVILLGSHHIHHRGGLMIGYRLDRMEMGGNQDHGEALKPQDLFDEGYMVSPTRMGMTMHMVEVMYGVTDTVTVMAMGHVMQNSMDHLTRLGGDFTIDTAGVADTMVMAHWNLVPKQKNTVLLVPGLTIPTGGIQYVGDTPMGADQQLPYPMQIGGGHVRGPVGGQLHRRLADSLLGGRCVGESGLRPQLAWISVGQSV